MDTEGMKCNRCAQPFDDMSQMGVTTCKHVYCLSCVRGLIHVWMCDESRRRHVGSMQQLSVGVAGLAIAVGLV